MRVSQPLNIFDIKTLQKLALSIDIFQAKFIVNSDELKSLIRNKLGYFNVYVLVEYNFDLPDQIKKYNFISPEEVELKKGGMGLSDFELIVKNYQKYKDYPIDFTFLTRGADLSDLNYAKLHKLVHLFKISDVKYESKEEMIFKLTSSIKFYTQDELSKIPENILREILLATGYLEELLENPRDFYKKFIMPEEIKIADGKDCPQEEVKEFLVPLKKTRNLKCMNNVVASLRDAIRYKANLDNFSTALFNLNSQQINELFNSFVKQPCNWQTEEKIYYILLLNHFDFGQSWNLEQNANRIHSCLNKTGSEFTLDRVNNFVKNIALRKVPYTYISETAYLKLTKNYSTQLLSEVCKIIYPEFELSYLTPQRYIASLGSRMVMAEKLILQSLTFYTSEQINILTGLMNSSENFYQNFSSYLNVFSNFNDVCNPILKIVTPTVLTDIFSFYSDLDLDRNFPQFTDRHNLVDRIQMDLSKPNYWMRTKDIATLDKSLNTNNIHPAIYYGNIIEYRKMGVVEVAESMSSDFKDPSYPFTVYFTPLQVISYNPKLTPPSRNILTLETYKKYSKAVRDFLREIYQALNFILEKNTQDAFSHRYIAYTYYDYFENKLSKLKTSEKKILYNLGERRLFDEALLFTRKEDLEMFEVLKIEKEIFVPPILLDWKAAGLFSDPFEE